MAVNFNDCDVSVEIYDSVIAKWAKTDYLETDPNSVSYLKNRDKIQPKLTAGAGISIDSATNTITAQAVAPDVKSFVSEEADNELGLGNDGKLYVGFSGLLRDGGSVSTRANLPVESPEFVAYYIQDEKLFVFAHLDADLGLVWLPLSFYVNMALYVSKVELSTILKPYLTQTGLSAQLSIDADANMIPIRDAQGGFKVAAGTENTSAINYGQLQGHNDDETAHPFILNEIENIREEMAHHEHFRGYYATTAEIENIPDPASGDYVYNAETGTKWIYTTAWSDSGEVIPDQTVEPYETNPLMNGVASPGTVNKYAKGDHVHPTDTSRVPTSRKINGYDLTVDRTLSANDVGASPKFHSATVPTLYGGGTGTSYGHVALSDAVDSELGADESVAASPLAVKTVNDALNTEVMARSQAIQNALTEAKAYTDSKIVSGGGSLKTRTYNLTRSPSTSGPLAWFYCDDVDLSNAVYTEIMFSDGARTTGFKDMVGVPNFLPLASSDSNPTFENCLGTFSGVTLNSLWGFWGSVVSCTTLLDGATHKALRVRTIKGHSKTIGNSDIEFRNYGISDPQCSITVYYQDN